MSIINQLEQTLMRFERQVAQVGEFMQTYPKSIVQPNKKAVDAIIEHRLTKPIDAMTEQYAHGECQVYVEAILTQLSDKYDGKLTVLYDGDTPVHFVACLHDSKGATVYMDAYGAYDNLDDIAARYTNNTVTSTVTVPFLDEDTPNDQMRDATLALIDEFDADEYQKHGMHYTDLYDDFLTTVFANNVHSIYLLNKANLPRQASTPTLGR